ncbi:MAG TPA: efflux RND transporter periplasmic adaptor subunit [Planctomycetota bacterium]|nr:efflux RND transporter periplasmic adaptor subunit [Planctomycetota bacterium]
MHPPALHDRARQARAGAHAWVIAAAVAVLGVAGWVGGRMAGWFDQGPTQVLEGATVQRGPLRITVTARGHLTAADSVSLTSEVEGRTAILSLVPEGTQVQKGDVVCELDATALVEKRFEQTITVANAEAAYVKAKQNHEIQQSQNRSDIAKAKQALDFAQQDLHKFLEGERESELERSRQAIDLAKEEEARAKDQLLWSTKLAEKGFLTNTELDADRIKHHRAEVDLAQAVRDLDLLERFQMPRQEAELRGALEEAERELERVELQAKARIVDFEADVRTSSATFELEKEKLARIESQIDRARMRAPRNGLVVYAQRDRDDPPIQEGTEVRERQEIMSIPSTDSMVAQAKVHESVLKQVKLGALCAITVDALQGQRFQGRVAFVAVLPDRNSWWANPNLRVYRVDVAITSKSEAMRPGMSCAIEILADELPDALHVPVQAVFRTRQGNVSFVTRGGSIEPRSVTVGRYNALWVQILDGLEEGETVLLTRPAGFEASEEPDAEPPEDEEPNTGEASAAAPGAD